METNLNTIYIVMTTFNRINYCIECIKSIYNQSYKDYEIILVDDNSSDGTFNKISKIFPEVILLKGTGDLWWAGATNMACDYALKKEAQIVLTLNDDLILDKDYLKVMFEAYKKEPNSLIGSLSISYEKTPKLLFAGVISHSYWTARTEKRGDYFKPYSFNNKGLLPTVFLPGRGTLIPKKVFKAIGLFDYHNFPQYYADHDFSIRAQRNGFDLYVNQDAIIYSRFENTGIGNLPQGETLFRFIKSFFTFKSPNYLPILFKFSLKHHPLKLYLPLYFILENLRRIHSFIRKRLS